jgi:hypothetical protein
MRLCNICGVSEEEVPFKGARCRECALALMSKYNKERSQDPDYKEARRRRWRKWSKNNKRERNPMAEKASKQSSPRRFLTDIVAHLRRMSRKKSTPFDIDLDFVCDLWAEQKGRCALTGVGMSYARGDLNSVRIDAVSQKEGYIRGNVQLVCDGVKRMKRDMPNEEVVRFIQEIRDVIII